MARSEEDRDEEGGKGRQEAGRQEAGRQEAGRQEADRQEAGRREAGRREADRQEAGRQEEQSEGEVREDKDEMVERGAENSDVAVTRHQFSKPNQPDPKLIAKQSLPKYTLSFQTQWYQKFPWLHVSPGVEGVLCFYCSKAFNSETSPLAKNADSAFISSGFKNWKKALERFTVHERSDSHKTAMTTHIYEDRSVQVQLSSVSVKQQEEARGCLLKIIGAVQMLARQGLPFRGHECGEGNFEQVLKYKSEDDPSLTKWLTCGRKDVYTSAMVQNEILTLFSSVIIREIVENIRSLPHLQYSVMMDGTRDVSGKEQEAVCLRYVDKDLVPREEFIGLYEVSLTTGENLAKVVMDVLQRLNLPITGLRGQAYDGAANMAGKYNGAQAIVRKIQPLAPYVHCAAHCVNLITQRSCTASIFIRNSLDWVNELGVLFGQSGKLKDIFKGIARSEEGEGPCHTIRPLCPTRWTVRTSAIRTVLNQYECIIKALAEMAVSESDAASKAQGLYETFQQGNVVLGLVCALEITGELEVLNMSLQSRTQTLDGMLSAVACVKESFSKKRNTESFQALYTKATRMCETLHLTPIASPRVRIPPQRFTGSAPAHVHVSPSDYYRTEFYKVLDVADMQFRERFEQEGMQMLRHLEQVLLTGKIHGVVQQYPEINPDNLKVQLALFRMKYSFQSSTEIVAVLQGMNPEVRGLFEQVETVARLLLVVPVSSAESERSFSSLRRLKTWLRSTMTQTRLNSVAVCHVHKDKLDRVNRKKIAEQFVSCKEGRKSTFGSFK